MLRLLATAAILGGLIWGCAQQSRQPERDSGHLVVGVAPDYRPFECRDTVTGEIVGFDIELIGFICEANRWRHEIVVVEFDRLLEELRAGRIDIAISALSITPEREVAAAFSDPYYLTGQALVVPAEDSTTHRLDDLRGKRVGVLDGSTGEQLARRGDGVLVFSFDDVRTALAGLSAGDLDAVINDQPTTRSLLSSDSSARVLPAVLNSEYYGIAMRKSDTVRLAKLNDALAAIMGGYTYESLHAKWFGYPPMNIAVPDSVAAQWTTE